jgi:hypothetical protein
MEGLNLCRRACGFRCFCHITNLPGGAHLTPKVSLFICGAEVEPSPLLLQLFIALLYQPRMRDGDDCFVIGGMKEWQEKPKYSRKTCTSVALSATEYTGLDPSSNPGRRCWKPATKRLRCDTESWRLTFKETYTAGESVCLCVSRVISAYEADRTANLIVC